MNIDIFFNNERRIPQWEIWYYHDNGEVTIHSDSTWKCKEDAEQDVLNRMLDGKV